MFENTFNIDDILSKDAGADSEFDYIAQASWVLFLRYLNELEQQKQDEAELAGQTYPPIIEGQYRWGVWACPKTPTMENLQESILEQAFEEGHDPVLEQVDELLLPALQEEFVGVGVEDGQVQFLLAFADVQRAADLDRIDGVHGGQRIRGRMSENAARAGHRPLKFLCLSTAARSPWR